MNTKPPTMLPKVTGSKLFVRKWLKVTSAPRQMPNGIRNMLADAVLQANGHEGGNWWPDAQHLAWQAAGSAGVPHCHAHQPVGHHGD